MEDYNDVEVFIEIPRNSRIKYEYDKKRNALVCDRVLHTPLAYNFNYGFIENTLSGDGDAIDVALLMDDELAPGTFINCRIIGVLLTSDDSGDDPKLIACPSYKVDPTYTYTDISQVSSHTTDKLKYFFSHYKDLEKKTVTVGEFQGKDSAIQILEHSKNNWIKNK
jgi:inorganic pyrophosphatase